MCTLCLCDMGELRDDWLREPRKLTPVGQDPSERPEAVLQHTVSAGLASLSLLVGGAAEAASVT